MFAKAVAVAGCSLFTTKHLRLKKEDKHARAAQSIHAWCSSEENDEHFRIGPVLFGQV